MYNSVDNNLYKAGRIQIGRTLPASCTCLFLCITLIPILRHVSGVQSCLINTSLKICLIISLYHRRIIGVLSSDSVAVTTLSTFESIDGYLNLFFVNSRI